MTAAVVAAAATAAVGGVAELLVVAAAVLVADVGRLALVGLPIGLAVPREPALHTRPAVGQRLPARVLERNHITTSANTNEKESEAFAGEMCDRLQ